MYFNNNGGIKSRKIHPILNPNQKQFLINEIYIKNKSKISTIENGNDINKISYNIINIHDNHRNINELNSELLDKHDSFYMTTKSLLNLFQIMGVMPIKRSPPKTNLPRTTYSWCSIVFFWAIFIYACETIVVVAVGKERFSKFINSQEKRFDEIIYNIIFISILFPHFLLPVASWRHGPQVAIFKNMWTAYQLKFLRVTGTPIVFPNLYPLTWGLCIFSWALSIVINLSQYYLQPGFPLWHTFAYYPIVAMLNGFCSLWYINCNAFGTASRALAYHLIITLESRKPAEKLTEYRQLWVDLSHMMQQLGKAYSNMYGIYCLIIFFTTIIAAYGALSEIIDHGATYKEVGLFMIVLYCVTLLFIICDKAHFASQSVGLDFQTKLLNVNLTAVDKKTQKEIEMFLKAIAKNPPIMNLDGYANINRKLITSNVSVMATYLVVLLQFKLTFLKQNTSEADSTKVE